MKKYRIISLILALLMVFSFCGCKKKNNGNSASSDTASDSEKQSVKASLLSNFNDSFDPFTAATPLNRQLCKLLYEPLIKVGENFEPAYCLAESAEISANQCKVKLRSAVFTDGSAVSSSDVVYSYNAAKASATYSAQLYEVKDVKAQGADTVVFNLTRYDRYFANLLDFPIMKSGSDNAANSDGVKLAPIGCGRYRLDNENMKLVLNDSYFGDKGEIKEIRLIHAPDAESESHYVEIGACDIYYADLSDGNIVRMSGKKCDVQLNNLVYIGINGNSEILKNSYLRYAISSGIDRNAICSQSYYTNAEPARGYLHPSFKPAKPLQTINFSSDLQITVENLGKMGYNNLDNSGYRVNSAGRHITLSLLVNSENASRKAAAYQIASQLKDAGIELRVIEKSFAEYSADLASGAFELYLGEIKILKNMDISQLVMQGGSAAFGVVYDLPQNAEGEPQQADPENQTSAQSPAISVEDIINGFYNGTYSAADIESILLTQMPQIPICYRKGLLFYDSDIESGVEATESDIYFSIEKYKYKK